MSGVIPQDYTFQAPTGIPGDITRAGSGESNVEPIMLVGVGGTVFPTAYGIPLKYVAGGAQQFNGGAEVAGDFAGVLIREVPSQAGDIGSDAVFTPTTPLATQVQGMLVRGYVNVLCKYGTVVRGAVVYIRTVVGGLNPSGAVGDFEAAADAGFNIALTAQQAEWATSGTDANFNAELRVQR